MVFGKSEKMKGAIRSEDQHDLSPLIRHQDLGGSLKYQILFRKYSSQTKRTMLMLLELSPGMVKRPYRTASLQNMIEYDVTLELEESFRFCWY